MTTPRGKLVLPDVYCRYAVSEGPLGRNGTLFTRQGKLMIRNAAHARDPRPVDDDCTCYACTRFSRGALRHLVMAGEMLGAQLATLHNLHFYLELMRRIRAGLADGTFPEGAAATAGAWA